MAMYTVDAVYAVDRVNAADIVDAVYAMDAGSSGCLILCKNVFKLCDLCI